MLHGRGADEHDLLTLAANFDRRLLPISVRAPYVLNPGYHWYELRQIAEPEPRTFSQSVQILLKFIDEVPSAYGVDRGQIYLLGFSQGATMAGAVALTAPDRIAGAIMLSGYLPLNSGLEIDGSALAGRSFFVGHGTMDEIIPFALGRLANDYLKSVEADLTYNEYPMGHQIAWPEIEQIGAWLAERLDREARE
jgi:phospholipase/carboxylesterase